MHNPIKMGQHNSIITFILMVCFGIIQLLNPIMSYRCTTKLFLGQVGIKNNNEGDLFTQYRYKLP